MGTLSPYPLTVVKMTIGGRDIITTAAISNTLPTSVLLGWDVPELYYGSDTPHTDPECPGSHHSAASPTTKCRRNSRGSHTRSVDRIRNRSTQGGLRYSVLMTPFCPHRTAKNNYDPLAQTGKQTEVSLGHNRKPIAYTWPGYLS